MHALTWKKLMAIFNSSAHVRTRTGRNAASANRVRTRSPHSAGYLRDTKMQCPTHHVDYVLRRSKRKNPTLLMYDCPEAGCFNTLQIATRS